VRQVGIGVAHALQDGELAPFPGRHERGERGVQRGAVGEPHRLIARDRELRTQARIGRIADRDERVESVIPALELDQHQQVAIGRALGRGAERHAGPTAERAERQRGGACLHEIAPVHEAFI
jgi:hypothetical protein